MQKLFIFLGGEKKESSNTALKRRIAQAGPGADSPVYPKLISANALSCRLIDKKEGQQPDGAAGQVSAYSGSWPLLLF